MQRSCMWKTAVDKTNTIQGQNMLSGIDETHFCDICLVRSGVRDKNEYLVRSINEIDRK